MDQSRTTCLILAACFALISGAAEAQFVNDSVAEHDAQMKEAARAEREARRATEAPVVYPKYMDGGEKPDIAPAKPPVVYFDRSEDVGSIIIDTQLRKLYFVLPNKQAYEYPISVGREGFTWTGSQMITRIASWPSWTPPPEMHQRVPGLPLTVSGGLKNPQGARALYLGSTVYRIHGTNNDRTVGRANSSGCFRLTNEHVVHLASIAKVGTKVSVLQAYSGGVSETAPLSSLFDFFGSDPEPAKPVKAKKPAVKKKPAVTATATPASAPAATVTATPVPAATTTAAPSAPTPAPAASTATPAAPAPKVATE
ncbi:MAG TPA: L,D-transpeptidase [Hyphomicrobium sp.]|nr:L,D-transpeptidase [Hyphomicrobium sp.]